MMAPPYGAFREGLADAMLDLGYEGACVSRASLTSWNKEKAWPSSFGHSVAEFVGTGLPIIPRHVLARGHEGSYRLAAFLNQPIIPHGHHQDCADGLDLVAHVVDAIGNIGDVVWCDISSISRSNYLTRQEGDVLFVKMLARRISLPVGNNVSQIMVERPWIADEADMQTLVWQEGNRTAFADRVGSQSQAAPLESAGVVELYSPPRNEIDPRIVKSPGLKPWTVTRRLLAEARDRMTPLATRLLR
ncbi:MAG: hypothetical protein JO347_10405 [Candidatus Eremiobacteraeota bacterium]|nr:hypothetical protein [Candidatus Eremiobacteraeota bacterium]